MDVSSHAPAQQGAGAGRQVAIDGRDALARTRTRGLGIAVRRPRSTGSAPGVSARPAATDARSTAPARPASVELNALRERSLRRGVNPLIYWPVRALLVPALLIYFRTRRIGREHLPRRGPLLFASNHRSFLDPFIIGTLLRRPLRFPRPERSSPALAAAVTERIWACVSLQWEWLGGVPAQSRPVQQRSDSSARRRRAHQKQDQRGEARAA